MKFADLFFVFMLFVFAVLLILAGILSFLLGSPSLFAAFGIFAGFGLCIGVFVGCLLSGRIKNTIGGRMPKGEQQTPYKNIAN